LRQILMTFDLKHFPFFLLVLLLSVYSTLEEGQTA
jgi:hypothetical protein